jgi:MFS family permease
VPSDATTKSDQPAADGALPPVRGGIWGRQLARFPDALARLLYLAIIVATTIVLYYELYVSGAVATSIMKHYHMSFGYFVYVSVAAGVTGALASLAAGLADRWGRANLVTYGVLSTGLLMTAAIPYAANKTTYLLLISLLGAVEGVILVATPALVRDFSPQLGRASAMGFWTLGPVVGSLVVTEVSSHTFHGDQWRAQLQYSGYAAIAVSVIAFVGLRELSPHLRDQLMVSLRDRALLEARARGVVARERGAWRRLLTLDVVGPALGISLGLIFYYTAVGFFVTFFITNYGYSTNRANSLANWFWITNAVTLIIAGAASDRLRVRKPFMIIGGILAPLGTALFALKAHDPSTGYYTFAFIILLTSAAGGISYATWMASFTETVEWRNPAAIATGLAIWAGILRTVVAVVLTVLAVSQSATSVLVDKGPAVQTILAQYPQEIATAQLLDPATAAALSRDPDDPRAGVTAAGEVAKGARVDLTEAVRRLRALRAVPKTDLAYIQANGPKVRQAQTDSPDQWRTWWWFCFAGQIFFLPFIFVVPGRWSPRHARRDLEEHLERVRRELAALHAERSSSLPSQPAAPPGQPS